LTFMVRFEEGGKEGVGFCQDDFSVRKAKSMLG